MVEYIELANKILTSIRFCELTEEPFEFQSSTETTHDKENTEVVNR